MAIQRALKRLSRIRADRRRQWQRPPHRPNACPEHPSRKIAEDWAETLRVHGYSAFVESQGDMSDVGGGATSDDNTDLMSVRARMA